MKRILLVILLLLVSFSFGGCNENRGILEESKKDLLSIKYTVQQYYLTLEQRKYSEALNYIEYINDDTKENDELWLSKSAGQYSIKFSKQSGNIVGYEYSPKVRQYRVITVVEVENKIDGQRKQINESIYLKKVNGNYKIMHISSEDMRLSHRGSSISTNWTEIYDKEKYITIP